MTEDTKIIWHTAKEELLSLSPSGKKIKRGDKFTFCYIACDDNDNMLDAINSDKVTAINIYPVPEDEFEEFIQVPINHDNNENLGTNMLTFKKPNHQDLITKVSKELDAFESFMESQEDNSKIN